MIKKYLLPWKKLTTKENSNKMIWFLFKTLSLSFCICVFFLFFTFYIMSFYVVAKAPLSFSVECLSAYIVFLFLSRNWPNLIKSTRRLENTFLQQIYSSKDSRKFSRRIRYIGWSFIFTAVSKFLRISIFFYNLSIYSLLLFSWAFVLYCQRYLQ